MKPKPFYSGIIHYSAIGKTITRNINKLAKQCWAHRKDNLKAPLWQWNDAKPALTQKRKSSSKKDAKFEKGEQLMQGQEYERQVKEKYRRVAEFFNNFKP
jgi:hypothetical protein